MSALRRVLLASPFLLALSASPAMADCDQAASVFFEYKSAEVLTSGGQTLGVLASRLQARSRVLLRGHVSQVEAAESELSGLDQSRAANAASTLLAAAGAKPLTVDSEAAGSSQPYRVEGPDPLFDRRVDVWVCPTGA
ncbi:MAG: hypothetical protein U1E18_11720 [Brevundimonas sp.]|uniref:hypothetical protein n=1 Tax=Brevundimonas sp. TaxID=1871086 RepID=UPI002722EA56|nr:hypothetical protein [Brevundimonas sp.]MDO9587162.1 hypothetical protein [Brevundimonas sp.]MDP3368352.1 hypothetical protein [Brevundimonas sp.]MDZ4110249.1 hypothetical protein [Brevundimonas sp.]